MATLIENLNKISECKIAINGALCDVVGEKTMEGVAFEGYADIIRGLQLPSGDSDTPSEPSTPTPSADYIYSNGYVAGESNDIATYIPYEIKTIDEGGQFVLDEDGNYTIELFAPIEYYGWEDVLVPDFIFGVDVPEKYKLLFIKTYTPLDKENPYYVYGNDMGFKTNIRHESINRQGINYKSYVRYTDGDYESGDAYTDPDALKNPAKYKIIIQK
jgi:hypothetical protein